MQISIDTEILESILTHSTTAARLASHIDNGLVVDALTKSLSEISSMVAGLLGRPYARQLAGEATPARELEFNVANAVDELRQSIRKVANAVDELRQLTARADALASAAEDLFGRVISIEDGDDRRRVERVAHLVGLTATAVHAASEAGDKLAVLAVELSTRRPGA